MKNNDTICVCAFDLEKIQKARKRLSKKESDVINALFGFSEAKGQSPKTLAKKYNCSVDEIIEIKETALDRLRSEIKSMHKDVLGCDMCLKGKWLTCSQKGKGYLMSVLHGFSTE